MDLTRSVVVTNTELEKAHFLQSGAQTRSPGERLRDWLSGVYLAPVVLLIALACRALERFAPLLLGEERMGN